MRQSGIMWYGSMRTLIGNAMMTRDYFLAQLAFCISTNNAFDDTQQTTNHHLFCTSRKDLVRKTTPEQNSSQARTSSIGVDKSNDVNKTKTWRWRQYKWITNLKLKFCCAEHQVNAIQNKRRNNAKLQPKLEEVSEIGSLINNMITRAATTHSGYYNGKIHRTSSCTSTCIFSHLRQSSCIF